MLLSGFALVLASLVIAAWGVIDGVPQRAQAPAQDHVLQAKDAIACGDFGRASKILFERLAKAPEDTPARLLLGQTFLKQGNHAKAREAFLEAKRLDPQCLEAHRGLASAWRSDGNLLEAARCLREIAEIKKDDAILWREAGEASLNAEDRLGALLALQRSYKLDPRQQDLVPLLGELTRSQLAGASRGQSLSTSRMGSISTDPRLTEPQIPVPGTRSGPPGASGGRP